MHLCDSDGAARAPGGATHWPHAAQAASPHFPHHSRKQPFFKGPFFFCQKSRSAVASAAGMLRPTSPAPVGGASSPHDGHWRAGRKCSRAC